MVPTFSTFFRRAFFLVLAVILFPQSVMAVGAPPPRTSQNKKKTMIISFTLDTCRIERIASERMKIDFSTVGMSNSVNELNRQYDQLLNTYYQK